MSDETKDVAVPQNVTIKWYADKIGERVDIADVHDLRQATLCNWIQHDRVLRRLHGMSEAEILEHATKLVHGSYIDGSFATDAIANLAEVLEFAEWQKIRDYSAARAQVVGRDA